MSEKPERKDAILALHFGKHIAQNNDFFIEGVKVTDFTDIDIKLAELINKWEKEQDEEQA